MASKCSKCKLDIGKEKFLSCDGCKVFCHENCSGLSASELRCMPLNKRSLMFLCDGCRSGLSLVPQLLNQIKELTGELLLLRQEVNQLKCNQPTNTMNSESLFYEIQDRITRSRNIMIYQKEESTSSNLDDRIQHDKAIVQNICSEVDLVSDNFKVIRIGQWKKDVNNRPMKVIFSDAGFAMEIMKRKSYLFSKGFRISADQTPMQRNQFNKLRDELKQRIDAGEKDISIRYFRGVPKITKSKN